MASPQSPFYEPRRQRFTFGLDWLLLITLVAAATATLMGYALSLPSVRPELSAWLGRTQEISEADNSGNTRRFQLIFLLMCFWAPLMLGLMARVIYLTSVRLVDKLQPNAAEEDAFRMED